MGTVFYREDGDILRCVETGKVDGELVVYDRLEMPDITGADWQEMAKLVHRMRTYSLTRLWTAVTLQWEGDYEDATLYVHGMRPPTDEERAAILEREHRRYEGPWYSSSASIELTHVETLSDESRDEAETPS